MVTLGFFFLKIFFINNKFYTRKQYLVQVNSVYFQISIFLAILVTEDGTNLFLIINQRLSGKVALKLQTSASRSVPTHNAPVM